MNSYNRTFLFFLPGIFSARTKEFWLILIDFDEYYHDWLELHYLISIQVRRVITAIPGARS
jgi:hypothetical protein